MEGGGGGGEKEMPQEKSVSKIKIYKKKHFF